MTNETKSLSKTLNERSNNRSKVECISVNLWLMVSMRFTDPSHVLSWAATGLIS